MPASNSPTSTEKPENDEVSVASYVMERASFHYCNMVGNVHPD